MNSRSPENFDELSDGISALVNDYIDRREAGEAITPEHFAQDHPDRADELIELLHGLPLVERALRSADQLLNEEPGTRVSGLPAIEGYELIEEIGRGGMGVVYKALQHATQCIVALKVMLSGPFASPAARRRFDREVQLAARLKHPNIARVLHGGCVAQQPFYAMDLIDGVRLYYYIADAEPSVTGILKLFC